MMNGWNWRELHDKKKSFFLKKRLLFCQASFFKFGRLSYVMALISSRKKMEDEEDQKTLFSVLRSWKIPFLIRSQNCIAFWLSNLYFKSWTDFFYSQKKYFFYRVIVPINNLWNCRGLTSENISTHLQGSRTCTASSRLNSTAIHILQGTLRISIKSFTTRKFA